MSRKAKILIFDRFSTEVAPTDDPTNQLSINNPCLYSDGRRIETTFLIFALLYLTGHLELLRAMEGLLGGVWELVGGFW